MSHPEDDAVDEAGAESFPASDPPSYAMGRESAPPLRAGGPMPQGGETRPAEAPLDRVIAASFKAVEPAGFRDHPRSSIETADVDVQDTIGGE